MGYLLCQVSLYDHGIWSVFNREELEITVAIPFPVLCWSFVEVFCVFVVTVFYV